MSSPNVKAKTCGVRVVKAENGYETRGAENLTHSEASCDILRPEEFRAYLIERRRAVITELEALNRLLKIS